MEIRCSVGACVGRDKWYELLQEQKNGEDIVVNCKMNEAVYLYKCTQCRVILPDRAAKFVMGVSIN